MLSPDEQRLWMLTSQQQPVAPDSEAIWRECHERLLAFIRRRVRSSEIAEDILQEVILRIHRHAPELERVSPIGAWVHRIASNAIADHYRSGIVRREFAAGSEVDPDAVIDSQPEGPDVRAELADCISPLLTRLPAIYREALTLTEFEGLTQAEAAARVGLSVSGMKSRVHRARRQLKRVLLRCCEIEFDVRGDITGYQRRQGSCGCGDCD
jgi:RNA polymerase sigma-70 factor (ECF subfamily)